jgi:arsenate reductase-like glutaredoxin family protein
MVAAGISRMTITIDRVDCDMMKKARARLGSHGAACNFHDHKTAGIARHVRFRLADASA